jgi:hypothetical protein
MRRCVSEKSDHRHCRLLHPRRDHRRARILFAQYSNSCRRLCRICVRRASWQAIRRRCSSFNRSYAMRARIAPNSRAMRQWRCFEHCEKPTLAVPLPAKSWFLAVKQKADNAGDSDEENRADHHAAHSAEQHDRPRPIELVRDPTASGRALGKVPQPAPQLYRIWDLFPLNSDCDSEGL